VQNDVYILAESFLQIKYAKSIIYKIHNYFTVRANFYSNDISYDHTMKTLLCYKLRCDLIDKFATIGCMNRHQQKDPELLNLPLWAWISLMIIIALTVTIGTVGIISILSGSDDQAVDEDSLSLDVSDLPVQVEIAQLPTFTPTFTGTPQVTQTSIPTSTALPTQPPATINILPSTSPQNEVALENTPSNEAADTDCTPPEGWEVYSVQQGDTLFAFQLGAGRAGNPASVDEIIEANCLGSNFLQVDQVLWLPPGAADEAPSSEPVAPDLPANVPRSANCPCSISIFNGWRIEQIADAINRTSVAFSGADFLAVVGPGSTLPARDFLASVPPSSGLEGFMFPGTYTLQNDTTAEQFRDMVLDAFATNAAPLINAATAQGITPYQALIMASIIEKESGDIHEQSLIASVFYNRLRDGRAFGATVTIMYALGHPGNWWPRLQSGQTNLNSPYNTYIVAGFPPTPISNPSLTALQAVSAPPQTNYFYFTGDCRGPGNAYAATYEEHLANVECR